ncbi:hypothetical protein ABFS83_01G043800 [Erythranthe nasuta]|uniref:uncharacterized protein LOC105957897 n=1 Tax=Erythranthe guttata TaxID=4155 RepID=UPI00064D83A0|nr:PREDICTED: uncharacterized protein LOC105957897 [Erythranthe guttata]|eukprot:XP_012837327.1 PREDICTED: uncharacterized protein LOC105957897 [Erythranthe guttata]
MEKLNKYSFAIFFSIIIASSLVSFALCLVAEFKKSKKNDLRLDGKWCYLPRSAAFELGIAALICLSITQVVGSLFICRKFRSTDSQSRSCKVRKPTVPCSLLVFSWVSFGIAVIIISTGTSMSQSQPFGQGWLDGECYLVRDGVYIGSAILAMLANGSSLGSAIVTIRRKRAEENRKVHHAQAET